MEWGMDAGTRCAVAMPTSQDQDKTRHRHTYQQRTKTHDDDNDERCHSTPHYDGRRRGRQTCADDDERLTTMTYDNARRTTSTTTAAATTTTTTQPPPQNSLQCKHVCQGRQKGQLYLHSRVRARLRPVSSFFTRPALLFAPCLRALFLSVSRRSIVMYLIPHILPTGFGWPLLNCWRWLSHSLTHRINRNACITNKIKGKGPKN